MSHRFPFRANLLFFWRPFGSEFDVEYRSLETHETRGLPVACHFATRPMRRLAVTAARTVRARQIFRCRRSQAYFRPLCFPAAASFRFWLSDLEDNAASHGFHRWHIHREVGRGWDCSPRLAECLQRSSCPSLRQYLVVPENCSKRHRILSFDPTSIGVLDPYACSPSRLVLHARRHSPQSSTLVFPRSFHQSHYCGP